MSPLKSYFGGKGPEVMRDMLKRYGEKRGKEAFYATANKQKSEKKRPYASLIK
jgi:hypothetical protein